MTTKEDIPQVAPHVFIRGEGGSIFKMDLPLHETIQDRLLKGYLTRVNEDGSSYVEGQDETPALPTERPAISASKATWVGWAVHEGMTPDDAEALTKTDLIEKFGAAPVKTEKPEGDSNSDETSDEDGSEQESGEDDESSDETDKETPEA
jgi:TATA-binding protein-associated factor Taf7